MKPIRRGQNPVKVPFAISTTEPILRDWFGEVREAIRNLSMRLPQGASGGRPRSSASVRRPPLEIITSKQKYHTTPEAAVEEGHKRVWLRWGSCMGMLADNYAAHFDCPQGAEEDDTLFAAKIYFTPGETLTVDHWEIIATQEPDDIISPPWTAGGNRPAHHFHPLGRVFASDGTIFNTGGGSLIVSEHVTNVGNSSRPGVAKITRAIYVQREGY